MLVGWLILMKQLEGVEMVLDPRTETVWRQPPEPVSLWDNHQVDDVLPPRHRAHRRWSEEEDCNCGDGERSDE